jgi:DNA polymerase
MLLISEIAATAPAARGRRLIFRDVEIASELDLRTVGAYNISKHPSTIVTAYGYAIDNGGPRVWHPDREPMPDELRDDENTFWVAHNDEFEFLIEENILTPRYGLPSIPLARRLCTMAGCLQMAVPGKLELAGKILGLEHQKDLVGHRLMMRMCKRLTKKRDRKTGEISVVAPVWTADQYARLNEYCMADVAAEREIFSKLQGYETPTERDLWLLDRKINARGFQVDRELADAVCALVDEAGAEIEREIAELTGGQVTSIAQRDRLLAWLATQGMAQERLRKDDVEDLLEGELPDLARQVLKLRQDGAQAASAK